MKILTFWTPPYTEYRPLQHWIWIHYRPGYTLRIPIHTNCYTNNHSIHDIHSLVFWKLSYAFQTHLVFIFWLQECVLYIVCNSD